VDPVGVELKIWMEARCAMLRHATTWRRGLATFSSLQPYTVFDRSLKRIQRDRAALKNNGEDSRTVDYLRNEVAERMIERLLVRFCTQYSYVSLIGYRISSERILPFSTLGLARVISRAW
jgi:hypothetical protein